MAHLAVPLTTVRDVRGLVVLVALLALPATAVARVIDSGSVLPPGQSGFVSITGLPEGTGSPHLSDQTDLFVNFDFKPATMGQPGEAEEPRAGVRIVRDSYGVPAVTGTTTQDMWWGAGYALAQDRLFQLEIFRRAARGRLAEVLGKSYLEMDVETRRDFYTDAELQQQLQALPPDVQSYFQSYVDGVNAWIEEARNDPNKLPGEFPALGIGTPEDFTLVESAAIGVYLARTIPSGVGEEMSNLAAFQALGPRWFRRLLPLRTPKSVTTIPRREGRFPSNPGRTRKHERRAWRRSRKFAASLPLPPEADSGTVRQRQSMRLPLLGEFGDPGGSDVWAIRGPGKQASLFTGPQLGYSMPELLVEVEVHGPGFNARGVTAVGVPVVGIGHNEHVAWGLTSGTSDDDDLYAERLAGNGEQYHFKGEIRDMDCRNETFTWRPPPTDATDPEGLLGGVLPGIGQEEEEEAPAGSQTERICRTVHGPVEARAGDIAYARRYAIWGREAESILGLLELNRADSIRDVARATRKVTWNENVMAADDQGNIGYWHPGLLPWKSRRWDERLPFPGDGRAEWRGFLPVKRRPHVINPKQGYLYNWNNKPSVGWTEGDTLGRQRVQGRFHHAGWLGRVVRSVVRSGDFGLEPTASIDFKAGTFSHQRMLSNRLLRRARRGAEGDAATVLQTIIDWNGSYNEQGPDGTIDAGAAAWQELKAAAIVTRMGHLPPEKELLDVKPSSDFDATLGEVYALRTLSPAGLRTAATRAYGALLKRFGSGEPQKWRQPRPMTETSAMGAGSFPPFPLFDRGTWQQVVLLGP